MTYLGIIKHDLEIKKTYCGRRICWVIRKMHLEVVKT